jgi:HEAT repeat protein
MAAHEIAVRISSKGELLAFGFPRQWSSMERSLALLPLFDLQLIRRRENTSTWTHREHDLIGPHRALYRITTDSPPNIVKTKTGHTPEPYQPQLIRSHTTFTLDSKGLDIQQIQGDEEHLLQIDESLAIQTHRRFQGRLLDKYQAPKDPGPATLQRFPDHVEVVLGHDSLLDPSPLPETETIQPRNPQDLDRLLNQFEQTGQLDPSQREALQAAMELDAMVSHLGESLREGQHQNSLSALLGLLSEAGSPACQRVLRQLGSDPELSENLRARVVAELGLLEDPDRETVQYLQSLCKSPSPQISCHAWLALGSTADQLHVSDPNRSRRIVDSMTHALEESSTPSRTRQDILLALGNIRSEESYQLLSRWCREGPESSRLHATEALGNLEEIPGVRSLLKSLANDRGESSQLVRTAVRTLGRQHSRNRIPVLQEILVSGRRIEAQLAALRELSDVARSDPAIHKWLAQSLRRLEDPRLQDRARDLGLDR